MFSLDAGRGALLIVEVQAFLNLRISIPKRKMVLQELTITLGPELDTTLNLDWSNDLFHDDPAHKMNHLAFWGLLPFRTQSIAQLSGHQPSHGTKDDF